MSKLEKIISKILSTNSDNNIKFSELVNLLLNLGFEMRISGSHHIFRKEGIFAKVNWQKDGDLAKPHQVKQVRRIVLDYKLGKEKDV